MGFQKPFPFFGPQTAVRYERLKEMFNYHPKNNRADIEGDYVRGEG